MVRWKLASTNMLLFTKFPYFVYKLTEPYQTLSPVRRTFVFSVPGVRNHKAHVMRMLPVTNFQNGGQVKEGN